MRKLFSNDKVQIRTGFDSVEQNLKDLLVPSSLPDIVQENCTDSDNIGCYRCHRQVCDACQNFLIPAKRIKMLSHVKVIKSDSLCHAAWTMSFIVPSVHCVTDNVLVLASTLDDVCQTTKVTLKRTREYAV